MQNYPNPFNPKTVIKYSIKNAGMVSLKVYNILGQEILELSNRFFQPGTYNINWDGRDSLGKAVSSGMYICVLKTNNKILTRKMMIME